GQTAGDHRITNAEFFQKLVHEFRKTIEAKQAGIFEIDLRLRPYGRAGNLAVLLDSFKKYYAPNGPAWDYERQALVKLRPITGDERFCRQITGIRDTFLYQRPSVSVSAIRAIRERQVRQLVEGGTVNAKFSPGGLVDLEYLVQGLQLKHGSEKRDLRVPNTGEALQRLAAHHILSEVDFDRLSQAHLFLRKLIEGLRIVRGNAKDLTVPNVNSQDFAFLARRLDHADDPSILHDHLMRHLSNVYELNQKLLD
ncbi:glutamine synthetase adenylyltransferase, partial [bacterium]|nr:glutamine synthetase adenylyltransferase [bacterium]